MKKLFTKHLFRAFTLLTLMLTTTLVANAAYWLRGDYSTTSSDGWNVGTEMIDFDDNSNRVYVDLAVNGTFYFQIYNDYGNGEWLGYTGEAQYGSHPVFPGLIITCMQGPTCPT